MNFNNLVFSLEGYYYNHSSLIQLQCNLTPYVLDIRHLCRRIRSFVVADP